MKLYIQIIAAGVAVVYVVGLWTSGIDLDSNWLRYYSIAVVILTVFWGCWDWWLWRAPFINCIRSLPPALGGTWQGTLRSSWDAPSGQELGSERVVYLVVRQTFSSTRVRLLTAESASKSSLASVSRNDGLNYIYMNDPRISAPKTSHIHRGATHLDLAGMPVSTLRGRYWTDRDTKGELVFERHSSRLADDYEMAQGLFLGSA